MFEIPIVYFNSPDEEPPTEPTINAAFPVEISMSGTIRQETHLTSGNLGISISSDFDLQYYTPTAIFKTDVIDGSFIISELHTGAKGNLELDLSVSGIGRSGHIGSGELSLDLRLSGIGRAGYSIGTGNVELSLSISGIGRSSSISAVPKLYIDLQLKGSGVVGSRAHGYLNLNDLKISQGSAYIIPHGSGALVIDFSLHGNVFTESYVTLVLNSKNFALTNYDLSLNSLAFFNGKYIGLNATKLYEFTGATDDGENISWYFQTGKLNLEKEGFVNHPRHVWLYYRSSGNLVLSVDNGLNQYEYEVTAVDTIDNSVRLKIGKGIKAKYLQLKLKNIANEDLFLDHMRLFTEPVRKKIR